MNENTPTNHYLLELIIKWKKHFIIVTILSIAASAIFSSSFFIAPIYKSFAIVYPSNIIPYSNESPTEQLVQLLEATDIRESVIQKFNLAAHYNIDNTVVRATSSITYAMVEGNLQAKVSSILYGAVGTKSYIYCRIGLPMNANYAFKNVSLQLIE